MECIIFELKKILSKGTIIIIIICSFFNIYKIYDMSNFYKTSDILYDAYIKVYSEKLKGEITKEKIDFVIMRYKELSYIINNKSFSNEYDDKYYTGYAYGDYYLFGSIIIPEMEYVYHYGENNYQNIDKANNDNIKTINRIIPEYRITKGLEILLNYKFSSMIIIIMTILYTSSIFAVENQNGINQIIQTSKYRGEKIIRIKLKTIILFIGVLSIYFYILNIIVFNSIYGIDGIFNPIYALKSFCNTNLNVNIITFLIIDMFFKFIGYIFYISIFFLVSYITKNQIIATAINSGLMLILLMINETNMLGVNSFFEIINCKNYFTNVTYVNILNIQIPNHIYYLIFVIAISVILYMVVILIEHILQKGFINGNIKK